VGKGDGDFLMYLTVYQRKHTVRCTKKSVNFFGGKQISATCRQWTQYFHRKLEPV